MCTCVQVSMDDRGAMNNDVIYSVSEYTNRTSYTERVYTHTSTQLLYHS